jgi:hypothetical protein
MSMLPGWVDVPARRNGLGLVKPASWYKTVQHVIFCVIKGEYFLYLLTRCCGCLDGSVEDCSQRKRARLKQG